MKRFTLTSLLAAVVMALVMISSVALASDDADECENQCLRLLESCEVSCAPDSNTCIETCFEEFEHCDDQC